MIDMFISYLLFGLVYVIIQIGFEMMSLRNPNYYVDPVRIIASVAVWPVIFIVQVGTLLYRSKE